MFIDTALVSVVLNLHALVLIVSSAVHIGIVTGIVVIYGIIFIVIVIIVIRTGFTSRVDIVIVVIVGSGRGGCNN